MEGWAAHNALYSGSRRRRLTFDEIAELYDRARPGYPEELIDDLLDLAGLEAGSRVVEIGCGTGQATRSLAERGLDVTCVELGEAGGVAGDRLASYPERPCRAGGFEDWKPPQADFDAVVAFTSFHWVDPSRCGSRSRRGCSGRAATWPRRSPAPSRCPRATRSSASPGGLRRRRARPGQPRASRTGRMAGHGAPRSTRAAGSNGSRSALRLWERDFTADEYVDVLEHRLGHRVLGPRCEERCPSACAGGSSCGPAGTVRTAYLNVLHVARRR